MSAPSTVVVGDRHAALYAAWRAGLARLCRRADPRAWEIPAWCVAVAAAHAVAHAWEIAVPPLDVLLAAVAARPELALAVEVADALARGVEADVHAQHAAAVEAVLTLLAPLVYGEAQPWAG